MYVRPMRWMLLCALAFPWPALAQEGRLPTDRPDRTESALVIPVGSFQMESGFTAVPGDGSTDLDLPQVLLRYGLAEGLELRVEGARSSFVNAEWKREEAWQVPEFAAKLGLGKGGSAQVTTALLVKLGLPTLVGDREGSPYPVLLLAADRDLGEHFGLGANLGMEWNGQDPSPAAVASLNLAADLTAKLGAFAEWYASLPEGHAGDHRWDAGLTWGMGDHMLVDASAGNGFQGQGWFWGAGFSFRLGGRAGH
jgi:hypothetical protein